MSYSTPRFLESKTSNLVKEVGYQPTFFLVCMKANSSSKQLHEKVALLLEGGPFELVDTEFKKEGSTWVLRVFIDHADGVTLDHCSTVTRKVLDMLEEDDPVALEYGIEVSSPGVDRPLVKAADFQRFLGERVFVKCHKSFDGAKSVTGVLEAADEGAVEVTSEENGNRVRIDLQHIAKATLKPILDYSQEIEP